MPNKRVFSHPAKYVWNGIVRSKRQTVFANKNVPCTNQSWQAMANAQISLTWVRFPDPLPMGSQAGTCLEAKDSCYNLKQKRCQHNRHYFTARRKRNQDCGNTVNMWNCIFFLFSKQVWESFSPMQVKLGSDWQHCLLCPVSSGISIPFYLQPQLTSQFPEVWWLVPGRP